MSGTEVLAMLFAEILLWGLSSRGGVIGWAGGFRLLLLE